LDEASNGAPSIQTRHLLSLDYELDCHPGDACQLAVRSP